MNAKYPTPLMFLHLHTDFCFLQYFLLSGAWTLDLTNQLGLQLPLEVCVFLVLFFFLADEGSFRNNCQLSVGTAELYHSTKKRQHSFHMQKFFCPTLIRV